jgi:hypothetical protein
MRQQCHGPCARSAGRAAGFGIAHRPFSIGSGNMDHVSLNDCERFGPVPGIAWRTTKGKEDKISTALAQVAAD